MPAVNTRHRLYQRLIARWQMVRDAVEGEHAVKAAGDTYLPKLLGAKEEEYKAYVLRAVFFEATRRTLQGLVGMVMQKDPVIEANEKTKDVFLKDLTSDGLSLAGFSSVVLREVLMLNKYGILADLPSRISNETEPFLVGYTAESIINWEFENIGGRSTPTRIVLEEEYDKPDPEDRFKKTSCKQYRVLELVDRQLADSIYPNRKENPIAVPKKLPEQSLIYRVQVWRLKKDLPGAASANASADEFILHEEFFPSHLGNAIDRIPFVIVSAEDEDKEDQKPPMEGVASLNMSHYRTSADLEHGRHFTALPTPYVIGTSEQQELTIGSARAWVVHGVSAHEVSIGMLEFTGQGLQALEKAMGEKESQMARLGARLLEEDKRAVEAAETHKVRRAGENSILASIANGVSEGLNEALEWMTKWDPTLGAISCQLNTSYFQASMDAQLLTALVGAIQSGKISFKTFYYNMQQRGMYPDDHTEDSESKLIEDEAAEMAPLDLGDDEDEEEEEENEDEEEEEGTEN